MVKIIMLIALITLNLFSKKLFLLMLFIILLPIYTFSMQHLTRENYSTFLKDKEIHNTIAQIKKTLINESSIYENHYLEQKKVHLDQLSTFFSQLTAIIETVINKQDTGGYIISLPRQKKHIFML